MSPTSTRPRAWVLYLALAIFAVTQIFGACADYRTASKGDQSDEISRCLTGYRLIYVDGPEARAREAEKVALGALAVAGTDSDEFQTAADDFLSEEADVDAFEKLNRRARLHPEEFLRECRARNP